MEKQRAFPLFLVDRGGEEYLGSLEDLGKLEELEDLEELGNLENIERLGGIEDPDNIVSDISKRIFCYEISDSRFGQYRQ